MGGRVQVGDPGGEVLGDSGVGGVQEVVGWGSRCDGGGGESVGGGDGVSRCHSIVAKTLAASLFEAKSLK